ncbi:MAG: type IV secretion system protein [Treponema sp.]|nr:type IV secretion system protein [Treponema sp.]
MNDWVDLPIINAIDYFQGTLCYFLNFARKYGSFFGLIGLVWTSIRLINSRIDMRSAWWDTLSKWFIFILLINFYWAGTNLISKMSNSIGLNAGSGKTTIINNFVSLKSRIEADIKLQEKWAKGLIDLVNAELGIELDYLDPGEDSGDYLDQVYESEKFNSYTFSSSKQKKEFNKKLKEYSKSFPDSENTIWSTQTLEALNSVLIMTSADGKSKTDLTDAYVTDKPELNIWLKDANGNVTSYFSSSAIFRIGILTSQVIWEKALMDITPEINEDGETEYNIKKSKKFSIKKIGTYIMAGICCICVVFAVAFALIQYVMCILEFTIVQGIGAGFIPFYLFDGTKDIPKKLVPVFTGFAIKILVMVICLIFVINMYLTFAADQISPTSGNMGWPAFGECMFICLLSFVLTSNAPKIAMTLLTGQPQLSMGEFVQAAGAFMGGAMTAANATKNLAKTALSPGMEAAKKKAHDWSEQRGASKSARQKQEQQMKKDFAKAHGIDTSTRAGQKNLNKKWDIYSKSSDRSKEINDKIKASGDAAAQDVKLRQKAEYVKNGGIAGSAGRLFAHYAGAVTHPKQTIMQGRDYHTPMSNLDIDRIAEANTESKEIAGKKALNNEDNIKNEDKKNNLPDDPKIGERQIE